MKTFYTAEIISKNVARTPENYLCLTDAIIGRSGWMKYRRSEIDPDATTGRPSDLVDVYRPPEELFSPTSMASAAAKPVTDGHPKEGFLNLGNHSDHAAGHILNVRRGAKLPSGEETLVADVLVTRPSLANKILDGTRECSCAYTCTIDQTPRGYLQQTGIVYNHVAVLPSGRGGREVRLQDGSISDWQRAEEDHPNYLTHTERGFSMLQTFDEFIPLPPAPMSKREMMSRGLVPSARATRGTYDAAPVAPYVDLKKARRDLLAIKSTVERSGDKQQMKNWNDAWAALANAPMQAYDAAADPIASQVQRHYDAARRRLQADTKPSRLRGA